jgi:hypothetical protein
MAKMFVEDAYGLGLLYAYIYSGRKMVLLDDLNKFYETIENNLIDSDAMDMYASVWYDNDPSIYYPSEGKNGEVYYVLYPDFDLERAKTKYIGCISTEVLVASQKDNSLDCIGLQKVEGNIKRKEKKVYVGISGGNSFMKQFIEKLKSGELKIEICPQVETGEELTEEFIIHRLEDYQKLLDSGIIEEASKEEQGKVKILMRK